MPPAARRPQATASSKATDQAVLDQVLHLSKESVTKTIERFRRIADRNTLKTISVQADRTFKGSAAKFMQENGMERLLTEIAEFKSLTEFTMKLLPLKTIVAGTDGTAAEAGTVVSVSAENLALFLEAAENLQYVKLIHVTLGKHFDWLEEALSEHKSLVTIELVNCDLTPLISTKESASLRFFRALSIAPALKKINLNNVRLDPDIPLNHAYAALVQHSNQLEDLTIKNMNGPVLPTALMDALQTAPKLTRLYFDPDEANGLPNLCLEPLGDMIAASQSLEEIFVRIASSDANLLLPVVQALQTNRALKKFHCLGNHQLQITPEVYDAMEEVLQTNFVFHLFGSINVGWPESIDFNLKLNRAGRQLLIEGPRSPGRHWVEVLLNARQFENLDCIKVVYYFLSKNPAIVQTFVPMSTESPKTKKRRRIT